MQALAMQTQLVEIEKQLAEIIAVFYSADTYQDVLNDISSYREQIYAAVGEEVNLTPIAIVPSVGTIDEQQAALNKLEAIIDSIEAMVPGNVTKGYASPYSGYPNALRSARMTFITSLYMAYQSEYAYLND